MDLDGEDTVFPSFQFPCSANKFVPSNLYLANSAKNLPSRLWALSETLTSVLPLHTRP